MNYQNTRTIARPKLSPRYGAVRTPATTQRTPAAALIPPIELRRLVAAMVD